MSIARSRSMRDAVLVLFGALSMHIATSFLGALHPNVFSGDIIVNTQVEQQRIADPYLVEDSRANVPLPKLPQSDAAKVALENEIPETTMVSHAPGWTVFKNLYMSNGTLYVVSSHPQSHYPDIQYITSTGLYAENTPENIAARMPTKNEISFITVEQARLLWGPSRSQLRAKTARNRIYNVRGNTFMLSATHRYIPYCT